MPDTYISQFSGEEIDATLRAAQIISGASTPAELRKKLEIRGDTIPVSAEDSTLISEALKKIPTTSGGGVNPNLLDNWFFGRPVNQRGQVEHSGAAAEYFIDRWRCGGYAQTIKVTNDGLVWDTDTGVWLTQTIVDEATLMGKTCTLSAIVNGELYSVTGKYGEGNPTVVVAPNVYYEMNHDDGGVRFVSYTTSNAGNITILAAKLELGDTQTLAHKENGVWVLNEIPDFGEQLARCQRYYRRWTGADNKPLGVAVRRESKLLELVFSLDTAMRVAPSLTFNGSFVCVPTFTWCSVTSIDVATPDTVAVFLKPNDDVTFDLDAYQINIAHANEYIALSADL